MLLDTVQPQIAYTLQEACRQLGCRRSRILLAISNRELCAVKIDGRSASQHRPGRQCVCGCVVEMVAPPRPGWLRTVARNAATSSSLASLNNG
jgi:hypothetical protein